MDPIRSSSLGSVVGAFIGDALGAYIEFNLPVTAEQVETALQMPGGGTHGRIAAGQVTDDSEMAMCLAQALITGQGRLDLDALAEIYWRWVSSKPFGLGYTVSQALYPMEGAGVSAKVCREAAIQSNGWSESNGSLMRLTPLCVWTRNLPASQAAKAARLEASMTHSSETIQHAGACYALAIRHLITHSGDREGAYRAAKSYAFTEGNPGIQSWFTHIETEPPLVVEANKIGWGKVGLTYAFRYLREGYQFGEAMKAILGVGGDTDTNAAIVGGMVGAAVGLEELPQEYVQKVMSYSYAKNGGILRPEFLDQSAIIRQIEQLITISPICTTVVIGGIEERL